MSITRQTVLTFVLGTALVAAIISCGGEEEPPSRDVFPIIKDQLFTLQKAVKERDLSTIDSLLTSKAVEKGMDADSLIEFVYGVDNDFPFERFGDYDIIHTDRIAQVICYIMDSAADSTRPMRFLFEPRGNGKWQIRSFESWMPVLDEFNDTLGDSR